MATLSECDGGSDVEVALAEETTEVLTSVVKVIGEDILLFLIRT